jgi:hypothetical protein
MARSAVARQAAFMQERFESPFAQRGHLQPIPARTRLGRRLAEILALKRIVDIPVSQIRGGRQDHDRVAGEQRLSTRASRTCRQRVTSRVFLEK